MHSPLIDVYPVGVLKRLLWLRDAVRARDPQQIRWVLPRLSLEVHYIARSVRQREWRAVKNAFNGYLAEHRTMGTRCGHGWTKRRALNDLYRHLAGRD